MTDRLNPGDDLVVIGSITSQDGRSTLTIENRKLILRQFSGEVCWESDNLVDRPVLQATMQGDGNFVMYGPGGRDDYIWDTQTDNHPGAWLTVQDDGNVVVYDQAQHALWATSTVIERHMVSGFAPSSSGLHFRNSFPHVPLTTINVLGQSIPIGDASNGLCGGMVFAVRDYFEAGIPVWPDTTAPSSGPLYDYIVKRLSDSFDLILPPPPLPIITPTPPYGPGPATYMWLMDPALPDHETAASQLPFPLTSAPHGRAWVMIKEEWPKIRDDIDNGRLSPMGLVEIKSIDPMLMGKNHQVLAYGYEQDCAGMVIRIYDPNYADDNGVTLSLKTSDPQHTTAVTHSKGAPVLCFFRPAYTFVSPPPPPPPPTITKCFIATASYGPDTIEVSTLRSFRDVCLLTNLPGRVFVALYERLSPPMAAIIARSPVLRAIARTLIVSPAYQIAKRKLARRGTSGSLARTAGARDAVPKR